MPKEYQYMAPFLTLIEGEARAANGAGKAAQDLDLISNCPTHYANGLSFKLQTKI